MMINKRLIDTVPQSKKYIAGNVLFQWISLVANIVIMERITRLSADLFEGTATAKSTASVLFMAAAAIAVKYICSLLSGKMSYLSSSKVKKTLRGMIYRKL